MKSQRRNLRQHDAQLTDLHPDSEADQRQTIDQQRVILHEQDRKRSQSIRQRQSVPSYRRAVDRQ